MSTVIIQIGRGVIIAEASSQQAGQALLNFFTEAVTGAANTFNNYQDAQALYDQIAA
ncbi:MAG: hypothetical protein ABL911_12730 [Gallionella sp.]|nr:hypothetical protein [Gallionella sp.]